MYERKKKIDSTIETFIIVKTTGESVKQRVQVLGNPAEREKYCKKFCEDRNNGRYAADSITACIWRKDLSSEVIPFTISYNLEQIVNFDTLMFQEETPSD